MPKLDITEIDGGVRMAIRARPGARQNQLRGVRQGRLVVAVTTVAEKGRANAAIIKLLARTLGVAPRQLAIASGTTSADKSIVVQGITATQLLEKLPGLTDC